MQCSPDSTESAVSAAVQQCSSSCAVAPAFNDCYCPCFKAALSNEGVVWAAAIVC